MCYQNIYMTKVNSVISREVVRFPQSHKTSPRPHTNSMGILLVRNMRLFHLNKDTLFFSSIKTYVLHTIMLVYLSNRDDNRERESRLETHGLWYTV